MTHAFSQKINDLKEKLKALPVDGKEPKVALFFSGGPVSGSLGIDASFIGKVILPFQKMVSADLAQRGYGKVGARGKVKNAGDARLFLTALPRGSFGIELSKLENDNLFDEAQVSDSLTHVVRLIESAAKSDEDFAASFNDISQRTISGLRQFLQIVSADKAGVTIESGALKSSLNINEVSVAYTRVANTITKQANVEISGILKGILLESWRFDFVDEVGNALTGAISDALTEDEVSGMAVAFLNQRCIASFRKTDVYLQNGRIKESYLLKNIRAI